MRIAWTFMFAIMTVFVFYSDKILQALGQQPIAIEITHFYLVRSLPGLLLAGYTDAYRHYLNCYDYTIVPLLIQFVALGVNMALSQTDHFSKKREVYEVVLSNLCADAAAFVLMHLIGNWLVGQE